MEGEYHFLGNAVVVAAGFFTFGMSVAVTAAVMGGIGIVSVVSSDIQRGEVSDLGTYLKVAVVESIVGLVCGAAFGCIATMVAGGGFNASCYNLSEVCYGRTPTLEGTIKSFEHGVMFTGGAMVVSKFIPPALGKVNDFLKGSSPATDTPAIELGNKAGVGKTGEGIPLEEVRSDVLKQIHPDENGAYGYVPKEGTAYHKPEYDFTDVDWAKDMQNVRRDYLEASKQLEIDIERMTSEGFSKEDIAKHVVDARNQQKVTARANMTAEERLGLEERNIEIYGNPIGPDSEWLFNKTKKKLTKEGIYINDDEIWNSVIKNSMKKDDVINTLLGLIH